MSLTAGVAAAALGFTAFRLASHEQQFRQNEIRGILSSECRLLADRTTTAIATVRDQLEQLAAETSPDKKAVIALRQSNPLIRETFLADDRGSLLYPLADVDFSRRYETLFVELVSANHRDADMFANVTPPPRRSNIVVSKSKTRLGREATADVVMEPQTIIPQQRIMQQKAAAPAIVAEQQEKIRMMSRFGVIVKTSDRGWIPWFTGNSFCPLIWAKCRKKPSKIVGIEVEMVAMQSRIVPLFPQNFPRYFRFEMTDSQGKVIFASGYHPGSDGEKKALTPEVILPVSDALLPGWQVRGYTVPSLVPAGNYLFALMLQIASLLLIIGACGGVALWLVRREIVAAGQKTSFVANVSHELKTPLTSIRMYAEMLHDHPDRLPMEKRSRYLGVILSESERLSRLIANVLDFSRIEAGKKKYNPVKVVLAEMLHEIAEHWKDPLLKAGMTLELQLPEDPAEVQIDRDSLVQVLQNLLSNAIKYAEGGNLVRLALSRHNRKWQLAVSDNGPGIPPGCRRKLFRKFYRCDDRLTAEKSGSGLGLAIARKLLRDQGGELVFQPVPGSGACFIITLPGEKS